MPKLRKGLVEKKFPKPWACPICDAQIHYYKGLRFGNKMKCNNCDASLYPHIRKYHLNYGLGIQISCLPLIVVEKYYNNYFQIIFIPTIAIAMSLYFYLIYNIKFKKIIFSSNTSEATVPSYGP